MRMHTFNVREVPDDADAEVWAGLMERLADSVEDLAEDFVARVTGIASYNAGVVSAEELRDVAVRSLGLVVASLADPSGFPLVERYARELGERRAQQGVPAEALTTAVRLNFPIIWSRLTTLAGPELMPMLATRVESVWLVLDNYAIACYSSYVAARMREARSEVSVRQEFIAALFTAEANSPEVQTRFSTVFEAPKDSYYGMIAINGRPSESMQLVGREPLRFLHEASPHTFLFWPLKTPELTGIPKLPEGLGDLPCGISVSHGLDGIAAAANRAAFLSDHLSPNDQGPIDFESAWPRLSRAHLAQSGFSVADELELLLAGARGEEERDRIRETVQVFLATGSIAETSKQLFAHRNTVLNRLRRFADLTGIDLKVPIEAAKVVVAWSK